MPHMPSLPDQVARRLLARFTAMTGATTANLNGDIATLIWLFAEELSLIDRTFHYELTRGYWFEGASSFIKARLEDMPLRWPRPQQAQPAVGGNFTLTRANTSSAVTYQPGEIGMQSPLNPDVTYTNAYPVVFGVGVGTVTGATFASNIRGAQASASAGQVTSVTYSADGNIVSGVNLNDLIGQDAETLEQSTARAKIWLKSLAQSQLEALESVALNFVDPIGGPRITHAHAYYDPEVRGLAYLVVDDGSGMGGFVTAASPSTGVFPTLAPGGRYLLMFSDYPAASAPVLYINGFPYTEATDAWTALWEVGEMWIRTNPADYGVPISPGDTWSIQNYAVYTGIIANLQKHINRFCTPAGGRVIVRPPLQHVVTVTGIVVTSQMPYSQRLSLLQTCSQVASAVARNTPIGKPLTMSNLHVELRKLPGVENFIPDQPDIYPPSPLHKVTLPPSNAIFR